MSTMVPQPSTGWQIVSQVPAQDFPATGGIVEGVRVTFRTTSGITDSVFVANTAYGDLDAIRAAIQTKADQHARVAALKG